MGWVWIDDGGEEGWSSSSRGWDERSSSGEMYSTRKMVRTQCKTEEGVPGKFIRKCEKTEEILRDCVGKPVEVLKSTKEYTEDDVTNLVAKGSFAPGKFEEGTFTFPGLRCDIEDIERHFLGGIDHFFEAAEEMKNSFFNVFDDLHNGNASTSSPRRSVPIEGVPPMEASPKPDEPRSGEVDLSGLWKDV